MNLERENQLLKEQISLLERLLQLQKQAEQIKYVPFTPPYPYIYAPQQPSQYVPFQTWCGGSVTDGPILNSGDK